MKNFVYLFIIILVTACSGNNEKVRVLPILGDADVEYKVIDGKEVADTIYPVIPHFNYVDQDSNVFDSDQYKNKIWVAKFFFTTCSTICPKMTKQMVRLQKNLKDLSNEVEFLSFTINPGYDQPSVLKKYATYYKMDLDNWHLLTGNEEETHLLGVEHFFVHADNSEEAVDGYAHSDAFTLVDREGHVRGVYKGTDPKQVDLLEKDLRKLLKYEYGVE